MLYTFAVLRRAALTGFAILPLWFFAAGTADAAMLTFQYEHHIIRLNSATYPQWRGTKTVWRMNGREIEPPSKWKVDGDTVPAPPPGVEVTTRTDWNRSAIRRTLALNLSGQLDRPAGAVTISRDPEGKIVFDGIGLTGRSVDLDEAVSLTVMALEQNVALVSIPLEITQPKITVLDPELTAQGIKEVVTVGESDYRGSPVNRRHNITVGLNRFNGHLIPKDTVFSFTDILGPVDGSTGYRKELVIKGDKTEPDYGGGLCQVSTTAYRGIWEYGFPIVERRNHSYAVGYYGPQGSDATVYPGAVDMKFLNDSPGALLMQTYQENDKAYFIYYGTRDSRTSTVWGPLVLGTKAAPPDRTVYTTELAPGVRRKVGDRHPGMTALWYRFRTTPQGEEKIESTLSIYEARPLFYEVGGVDPNAVPVDINTPEPPRIF